jgi:hypothetical protein
MDTIAYDHYLFLRGSEKESLIRKHWQRTARYLRQIKELLAAHDIPLVLGVYPYGVQISATEWDEGRVYWGFEKGTVYDDPLPFDIVREFAHQENIPFVNSTGYFEAALDAGDSGFFYSFDGHLSPKGNRLVARSLVNSPDILNVLKDYKKVKTGEKNE